MTDTAAIEPPDAAPACADDDHDWHFKDDSFDHDLGTQTVHYWLCKTCGAKRQMEAEDYYDDD